MNFKSKFKSKYYIQIPNTTLKKFVTNFPSHYLQKEKSKNVINVPWLLIIFCLFRPQRCCFGMRTVRVFLFPKTSSDLLVSPSAHVFSQQTLHMNSPSNYCQLYLKSIKACSRAFGLVVWFSLWVREVPSSILGMPQIL